MVFFKIIYKSETEIRYEYYPEKDKNSNAGLIGINITDGKVELIQPAEQDREVYVTAKELNAMSESINQMRIEAGEEPYSEEELPTAKEDIRYYQYASHAIHKIQDAYDQGCILKEGIAAWY